MEAAEGNVEEARGIFSRGGAGQPACPAAHRLGGAGAGQWQARPLARLPLACTGDPFRPDHHYNAV